jgi:hypothetical protein
MSPVLAPNGHASAVAACPLLRDQRTLLKSCPRSEIDPEWKFGQLFILQQRSRFSLHSHVTSIFFSIKLLLIKFVPIHHSPTLGIVMWTGESEIDLSICQVCCAFSQKGTPMKDASRLQELEANCRERAVSEPDRKWYWLAQAAKCRTQADCEISNEFADAPEVKLAKWPRGNERRLH